MRKRGRFGSLLGATIAVAMAALIGAAGFGSAALAQQAQTADRINLGDLFTTDDSVDLKPEKARELVDAARKAKAPGQCPLGALFIFTPAGDPLFQQALAGARREVVLATLQRNGVDGTRFFVDSLVGGNKNDATLDLRLDQKKPKLTTTSVPPKGRKVKGGDLIKVTMVARDDAEPKAWQTGIKTIQLVADSEGGRFIASENYEPCAAPPEKRVVATYTVPSNPPPIVRLTALAEDHASLMDTDVGEFPTGDWYGRFGWTHICTGGGNTDETHGIGDLTLDYDGRGNLTGRLVGSTPERKQTIPPCTFAQVAPATFSAKLIGSYTPSQNTFSAQAVEVRTTPGRASFSCPAGGGVVEHGIYEAYQGPMFKDAFRDLRRQPDGSLKSKGEHTHPAGGGACTTKYSLTLRKAQN